MSWLPKQTVVVPIDFSEESFEAVKTALELAAQPKNVHVIYVMIPLDVLTPGEVWGALDHRSRENSVQEYFDKYLADHQLSGVNTVVRLGDPGLEIADYAKGVKADLIVLQSHGYHGVKRLLLGSTAERIIRHADCPVLVLRRSDSE